MIELYNQLVEKNHGEYINVFCETCGCTSKLLLENILSVERKNELAWIGTLYEGTQSPIIVAIITTVIFTCEHCNNSIKFRANFGVERGPIV